MAERPLYTLYKNLKAQNYDVPDDYNKFESALTRDGKGGADNRHAIYENLKAQNFDVPSTYERFYSALFEPRSRTSSRAKGGSVPMSAADRARFSAGAAVISASAQQTMNNAGRYNRLKQRKQKQQKDFGRVNLGTHQTPYGGDANNVVKDDFAYNPETGKTGAYVTSDNENVYSLPEAEQMQAILDKQNDAYQVAVDTGEIPSAFDVRDKNGNYDLQENIGKNGTYLTEEGAQKQFDKKLADAYARKKEIEALIAEDNRQHGNPLLSYGASIGASNGRTAEQSDYRNKLATSLSLVTEQIGALEAVKQYPTSSWVEDALKALDNTAFTAKTWDFGLTDFAIMGQMERIKTKMDNNIPLSGSDKMLLKSKLGADAATALEDEKMGNVYRWTKIAGQSLPFMADFFLTGGYGGITKGISRGALKFAAKRGMGKVSAAILKNTGIVAGDVIGSYAMAGTEQALKTGADIMQRHLGNLYQDEKGDYKFGTFDENGNLLHEGGESIGTALYKGMTSAMVENYTEKLFGHNYGIKKGAVNFMEKHGMNASAEFFKNIGKSGWYTNSKKWMEKFGINGFAEEVMEEEIGIPLHALLDGEGKVSDLLDAKQQLDIIGGMAISVGSMYAMGAGSRPAKGIYNRAQYYRFRNKVNVADIDAQNLMGDNWADIKDKIDNATNEQMGSVLADILRKRDTMTKEQINAAVNYGVNLMKMRGYNIAKTAEMNAKEITNEPTTPEEQHQSDIDNAYSEGHDADDADKHDIQIQQEDQMKTLAAALGISEQQLSAMSDEELESLTGQDDKLDQAIYDYQLSYARYKGVVDDAQDKVDLAAHQAEQRVDMYTDQSRGSVRNATIKASGGLEDYGVYIISGNIATHDDGSIDVSNSDDMILYFDPTTNSVEHADAFMFAELGEELPADDVKAQAVYDAKENAIKKVAGIIDGTVEVGSQFNVTDTDGTEHTYEVLADYGDGTAAISIDGNVVENPYSLADLQQMKDLEDQKRLEAAKAEREQMEKERAAQQTQETQPSFDFNQILNDNGNVVLADVLGKDGNTKYPNSQLFLIRDSGAKAKVVELKSDGTLVPHAVNKKDVRTATTMTLDEYKQAFADSSMIEDNSGEESDEDSQLANLGLPKGSEIWMSGDGFGRPKENTLSKVVGIDEQGSIVLEDKDGKKWSASFDYINNHRELPPLDENANIVNEENNQSESNAEENTPAPEQTPAITLEDGTIVPMLEDGNPDFSKLTAEQTAELYDSQFGEDADSIVSGYVSDAKKALDKASNMTVKGKTFVEQKAAKDAKEKAIADAQAAYDSAIAIRDAYNERQLAKVEDTAEGRKELIEKARRKFARLKSAVKDDAEAVSQLYRETIGSLLHRLYDGTGIDVTDTTPLTAEEYVASNLGAHSLNYEGTETSKGVKQETGLSREDFAKTQLLAADGKGTTIDALVHSLWENRPSNLESLDTQDIRNALIGVLNSGFKASEARNFVENIRIAQAENILEEQKRAQENAAYAEQQKAEQEAELKAMSDEKAEQEAKSEAKLDNDLSNESNDLSNESDNEKINDNINDKINTPELSNEQQKAKEDGEKLGFPAVDNEGEPINQYVIELANWAKEQGLEIDPTSKWNNYADLFIMCKDGFGVGTLVPDRGESINQVVYFPDNVQDFDQLWKLHEEFNVGRDLKHSADMDNEQTQGAMFYDGDTAREFKEYVDKKVKEQNKVFGEQRSEEDLPFSAKENGKQQTTAERAADVEKNKVDDMKVVDNIVGQKTRKAFERLAKMMGANIQWQYSDKLGNGWIQETKDADGNVHRTIFITLDSSITEGAQFIFGHEMTHQIKNLNPAAYNELTQLVLDTYGSDAFDKAVDETMQRYSDAGFSGRARDYYAEEVVADAVGEMIRDLNLAHTLAMKMSHPLLAAIHEILQKIKLAFYGTEYSDVTKNIIRSIEQAYVKTANGEVTNSETGEDVPFSLRQKPEPKKKGIGYKVFVLKDGKLYPPMVANPDGAATPVGVWLDADAAPIAGESKTGRPQVKQGGKGTQGGSGKLAYRPGWHLGVVPYAIQFNRKDAEGNKTLFPKNFVFAEVEYAADVDYQEEARQEGINPSGKYQHSLAGLKHLPTDGYYMYRTNPNPDTDPWVITGAMKVNRILTRAEQAELVKNAGREPQQIQEGDIVTDYVVNSINQEIADAPKFSLKVYHGSGADFTEFDFDHMGEGAGSQVFGWGGYVTSSEKIGKSYAGLTIKNRFPSEYDTAQKQYTLSHVETFILEGSDKNEAIQKVKGLYNESLDKIEHEHPENNYAISNLKERIETLDEMEKGKLPIPTMSLYEVDIPEDNGSNYLEWYGDVPSNLDKEKLAELILDKTGAKEKVARFKATPAYLKGLEFDIKKLINEAQTGQKLYTNISSFVSEKDTSKILSSLGFTGIKYPAGTIMGGAEENDTNYVVFKPEDMKITEHTKFSIKTYHGSQASFDKFDHSFMGSGEGAQAYGWGTYVSEVEGIAKAYAKQNANKHSRPQAYYKGEKLTNPTGIVIGVFNRMDVDDVSAKEAIARLIEEREKKMNATGYSTLRPKLQKEIDRLKELNPDDFEIRYPERNLYSVDIPDDTGRNYIGWDEPLGAAKIMRLPKVFKADGWEYKKVGQYDTYKIDGNENEVWLEPSLTTGKELYRDLTNALGSDKAASEFLSKAGFVGVKVIAQRNTGGNKNGMMNYVIFDENNAQVTSHTKFSLRLKSAIEETETNPSDAQKESGNYKKGHIKFGGYDYTIENPKGSTRSGKDADGKEWKVTMHDTYGYIRGKFGKDGDHLDMFINDKADLDNWNGDVFVVDQVNPDGSFDEHKVMYGYDSMDDAKKAYLANYSDGWQGLGNITGASKDEFDKWLDTSNRKLKPFADYAKVKFSLKDIKPVGVGAFGNIYNQFRGNAKAAIEFLKKVRGGEAVGALHHKDIGDIDLVWGKEGTGHSDGYGLSKLVKYHPEVLDNLQEILNDMRVVSSSKNRVNLESETHKAGVRLTWDGERKSWLLTAFKKETSASDKRTDTAATSLEGDTALSQTEGSAAKIDNSSETAKKNGEKFSLKDEEYLKAVEDGDMEKAQKMVNEAAEKAGYTSGSDYQGTSAFNGSAPFGNGYFFTKEERKEAWENGDYDGDQTLGDYINRGIDAMNLDFIALDSRNYRSADPMRKEAIENVRNAIQKNSKTITMYRSVPADVKEGSFRNGDWVTPSRSYAVDNAKVHGWGDNYNIIEQKVPVDEIWWDGNDIAEWGYGREEDYINDTDFAYKNTKNNKKLLDAVTYDDEGNVIPLSKRFNEADTDIRFSLKSMMEKPEGWKQANKKAIHIAEAIERDPKFSLKNLDGTLIKAGTYFSGGGLVEEGLKGIIDPVVAVEYDEKISGVYRNNFGQHIVTADVRDVDPKELVKQIDGEVEYFHASPVCKNYSQAKSNHAEVELDKETAASTAEFINAVKPKVVTIENVKGYKDSEAMKIITDALDANGYTWDADVYNAADYGGYTNRERLIVRAVRDGKLPAKPKKLAHKSGWYEAVADIIPTLTEKKNGVAPWMDIRLKADGIDWRNIDKPLYVMGSAYADGKVPHAFADELLPTLRTKSGDVIVMPDGKVYRAMGRVLARVSGVSDDYKMPFSENLSHTIIGNGIPTQLTEHVIAPLLQNTLRPTTPEDGNTKFSLRYDQFEHDLNQWKKDNNLPKDAKRPTIPQRNAGESAVDFLKRVDEYRKQMALWKTAPTYEQHLLSDDTALGEFNRELQRGSVLKRIAFQDSMLAIRKAQEAIMKEVGVDRLNMAEDAYTAENRSHGKGKNEFEEYNNEFLQPLRKAYHQMKKVLGDSYDNVRIYMMAKHGLERDAQMAFKKSLDADFEDVAQRSAAYRAYKGDMNRIINDSDLEFGRVDFTTWRQRDNALRAKYSPSYMDYRYDENGIVNDYSGLSALFDGSDFEEAAYKLVKDIEDKYVTETHNLWDATNAATKKILRDGYKAGMMSKDTYQYVRDMYSHYIPLRGWDGTTADQVWDYVGGGKGAFNQTLKTAHGRTSIADDPIAYIENMAESGILLNNKNWVKQHLMLLAQNHPTSLLTLSKAWYVKSTDANGNEEWIPATPQITSQMNSNQVKAAIDAFEKKMEKMAQNGDATQKRDGLNIAYPQTHSEEREHEVRVMKDGEEYVIYVNGDPQLAQAMNNTRAHRVSEGIKNSISKRVIAVVGRKMAAAYTSLSPLFIPSNYFRDLTMTLASTAIREDAKYNYLLSKNLATSWNLGFMLKDYQNGKLREKVSNGNATPKEQMFYDFMMNGGETGFVSSLDVEDLKKKFKNDLKDLDRWKANPVKVGHTIMDCIEFLNRMIEDSNRFAIYMTSIQYGRSIDEAVNDAKDVTLNFNRKGTGEHSWQTIRNLYLFINPAVQSLQTLGALAKHHPFKFTAVTASWLASGVLVPIVNVALMQLGAAFLGGDGDDDKDWYKDISKKYWQFTKWDRRNNFIMWVPTTHEFVKIPLAQEFRAFYGLGDMIASKMMGGELAEESWEDYGWDLVGQVVDMFPLDPTGYDGELGVSLMPNPIRPVFELAFNVDFTGKPLFKDTEYNKYDPNFTKAYVGTPDWLVRASRMMNSIGNDYPDVQQNKWDALGNPRYNLNNPAVVDHVLSSYLGGAYTMGSQVLGLLTKSLNDRKEIKVADIPLVSKFVSNPDDRPVSKKQGDEFWDKKEYYDRASNTISKLKKQAKIDGDYSLLERFYGSEEYKTYKLYEKDVKDYKEARKKERAEESGDEYRPHQLNAEDIYNNHATPMDEFEDMKLKQLFEKLNSFKTRYDAIVDNAPNESDGYYNTNKAAIDAIDEISLDKQEISELKKGFLDDGKDAYNAEDMKQIRDLRKKILAVLEKANKVVVANQKAKTEK